MLRYSIALRLAVTVGVAAWVPLLACPAVCVADEHCSTSLPWHPDKAFPAVGEWTAFRADASLSGRARGKGRIEKPAIRWRYDFSRLEGRWLVEPLDTAAGKPPGGAPLDGIHSDDCPAQPTRGQVDEAALRRRFRLELPPIDLAGRMQSPVHSSIETFADVLPDYPGAERFEFPSAFNAPTVNGQWQDTPGRCYGWRDGAWRLVWQIDAVPMNFGPYPIVDDFDGDGRPEVAVLPWYELRMYDARTGAPKHRCRFTDGRSYGAMFAEDLDGDGRRELIVMADFAKHVDVFGFRGGKLTLFWRREIETDICDPQKILRVLPQPAGDLDGDGVKEIVLNLFNESGDRRWHTLACDGLTGRVKADWPDEIAQGLVQPTGGLPYLLTSTATGQGVPEFGPIRVRTLRGGRSSVLWETANAGWQIAEHIPSLSSQNYATFGRRAALASIIVSRRTTLPGRRVHSDDSHRTAFQVRRDDPEGSSYNTSAPASPEFYAVLRKPIAHSPNIRLTVVAWQGGAMVERMTIDGPGLEGVALDERGAVLLRGSWRPGDATPPARPQLVVRGGRASVVDCTRSGTTPGPAIVVRPRGESRPTIVVGGPDEEVFALQLPPGNTAPGATAGSSSSAGAPIVRWRAAGRCQGAQWPAHVGAVAADLRGDGGRQILHAAKSPSGAARLVACDVAGGELWHHDFPDIPGDAPVWNVGGLIYWNVGRFTGRQGHDVLVTLRRSMMHSEETCVLSGVDGRQVWRRPRQISSRGCGGQPFAVADYNADGRDDAASLHPSIYYILDGPSGRDLTAKDCIWPSVPMKPVYWGQPVAIAWPGDKRPATLFTTGARSMIGVIRPDGALAWSDAYDRAPNGFPAIGDFGGRLETGGLQALWFGFADGARCYDTVTGKVLWTLPLAPAQRGVDVPCAVAGDLNGDGRDDALAVVAGRLVCVGTDNTGRAGRLLWSLDLPVATSSPTIADISGDGRLSILLVGADASLLCVE